MTENNSLRNRLSEVEELDVENEALREQIASLSKRLAEQQKTSENLETARQFLEQRYNEQSAEGITTWHRLQATERPLVEVEAAKNNAYHERDMLVAALSDMYASHLTRHPESDTSWERDWMNIVCVHGPTGQMTWHIHDSELPLFEHITRFPYLQGELAKRCAGWDGHTTEEKYRRLALIRQAR